MSDLANHNEDLRDFMLKKVGHEMRAPLAAILSILDTVTACGSELSEENRRLLERARGRAHSLLELVDDLRRYWRLQAAPETLEHKTLDFAGIVKSTAELFGPRAKQTGVELFCECESCPVTGDQEMLREVATNLLANAIQYTPAGGRIALTLRHDGAVARLQVRDTGIGIAPETAAKLFKDFYRAPQAREMFPEGTGLGLSIVKRICELHGGSVRVESPESGGTMVIVELPLDPGQPLA